MNAAVAEPISEELLRRFDVSGPRYTSYPTADRFVEAFTAEEYKQALTLRRAGTAATVLPLSLYVHIPFCESLCYYCACNKIITKHHDRSAPYLNYLSREVDLHTKELGLGQAVSQVHLGGGSPTFMSDDELRQLMAMLRRNFTFVPGGEYSIEVDPRTIDDSDDGPSRMPEFDTDLVAAHLPTFLLQLEQPPAENAQQGARRVLLHLTPTRGGDSGVVEGRYLPKCGRFEG